MASYAAGLATAAIGDSLFEYNRANFKFDGALRFERFQTGREYAMQQTNQYRADLRKMAELTSTKMNMYHVVGVTVMMLDMAVIGAGRLGLHGPSPPGWVMTLFLTNNAASLAFMAFTMWFAMHAACRANACSVHLLTRYVRVPVPTQHQLNQARVLGSDFEHMKWRDIMRVPFIGAAHPEKIGDPNYHDKLEAHEAAPASSRRSRSLPGRNRAPNPNLSVPTWIRDEWELDRAGGVTGPPEQPEAIDAAPEHFRLYSRAQAEWVPIEVYARLCMTYGVLHFLHACAFYSLGHINCELRSFYTAYSVPFCITVAHQSICHFEFCRDSSRGNQYLPYFEFFGFFSPMFAAIAMSIEFRDGFSKTWIVLGWIIVFIAYFCQLLYSMRLWDIALPDTWATLRRQGQVRDEVLGANSDHQSGWWPKSWVNIPTGFRSVLYIVAPPERLQEGQVDLVREMNELAANGGNGNTTGLPRGFSAQGEELTLRAGEVDDRFRWWFSQDGYWDRVTIEDQERVRALFHEFQEAQGERTNTAGLATAIDRAHQGIDKVEQANNLDPGTPDDRADGRVDDYMVPQVGGPGHGAKASPPAPWKLVMLLMTTLVFCWCLGILGCILEVSLGEQFMVSHVMINPMTRPNDYDVPLHHAEWHGGNPAGPGLSAAQTEAIENAHVPPHHRRLSIWEKMSIDRQSADIMPKTNTKALEANAFEAMQSLAKSLPGPDALAALLQRPVKMDEVQELSKAMNLFGQVSPTSHGKAEKLKAPKHSAPARVHWPGFFEPRLLACQGEGRGGVIAAITPRGIGAAAHINIEGEEPWQTAEGFTLTGLSEYPPILSATWGENQDDGLLLVSRAGHLITCPGRRPKAGGLWACSPITGNVRTVPVPESAVLHAAAATWMAGVGGTGGEPRLHAAVMTGDALDLVAIYALEGEGSSAAWLPLGDVAVPRRPHEPASKTAVTFVAGDILVATERGEVVQRRLSDGVLVANSASSATTTKTAGGLAPRQWQGVCGLPDGGVAHLALHKSASSSSAWHPIVAASGLLV